MSLISNSSGRLALLMLSLVWYYMPLAECAIMHEIDRSSLNDFEPYFGSDRHQQHSKLHHQLFNPYNHYTVDQLLVKVPSILEEPDTSDSNLEVTLQAKSLTPNEQAEDYHPTINQNLFQQSDQSNQSKQFSDHLPHSVNGHSAADHNLVAKSPTSTRYRSIKRLLSQIQFNCSGRAEGYYADVDFDCHIFHYCKQNGFKFTFICPGQSVFSQEELSCDSAMRNPAAACRQSANYYFLNSMLYTKGSASNEHLHLNSIDSSSGNASNHRFDPAYEKDFGKWVTYIATAGTVNYPAFDLSSSTTSSTSTTSRPSTTRSITKVPLTSPSKPKRNKAKPVPTKSPSMGTVKLITQLSRLSPTTSTTTTNRPVLEKHSSELSVSHSVPASLPDSLLTSPTPPMEQIDTPKWFPPPGESNATNDMAHLSLDIGNVNIYSQKGAANSASSQSAVIFPSASTEPTVRVHFGEHAPPPPTTEAAEATDIELVVPPLLAQRNPPVKIPPRLRPTPSPKWKKSSQSSSPGKHKISNPFQVEWDDDDQMLVEEFAHQAKLNKLPNVVKAPLTLASPDDAEAANYLFGKPLENIPEEHVQFSPVDFESLLDKIPNEMQTLPMDMPSMDPNQLTHFGNFAPPPLPPPSLHMMENSLNSGGHKSKQTSAKSQIKLLLGNLVGGGTRRFSRRWFQKANPGPMHNIWPLVDGMAAARRHDRVISRPSRHVDTQSVFTVPSWPLSSIHPSQSEHYGRAYHSEQWQRPNTIEGNYSRWPLTRIIAKITKHHL